MYEYQRASDEFQNQSSQALPDGLWIGGEKRDGNENLSPPYVCGKHPLLREHAQRQVHPLGAPFDHMVISNFLRSQYSLSFQLMGCEFVIDSVTWLVMNHVGAHHMSSVVGLYLISQSHFQALVDLSTRLELLTTSSTNADHHRM